jgi:hypothetical protein
MSETDGQTVPKGRVVSVRFEFAMPAAATREQVDEWIAYVTGARSSCMLTNPLLDFDLQALEMPRLA